MNPSDNDPGLSAAEDKALDAFIQAQVKVPSVKPKPKFKGKPKPKKAQK